MPQTAHKTDEKQRYSFNEDKTRIRADQRQSVPMDAELQAAGSASCDS